MKDVILVVDDEPANVRTLERLLRADYKVLTATSGSEALELLKNESVRLIITDQRMPGMTGTEMLRESMSINPDTVKIILTGYSDIEALIDAINSTQLYKYVSKPWDPVVFKQIVKSALDLHRAQAEQKMLAEDFAALINAHAELFRKEVEKSVNANQPVSHDDNPVERNLFENLVSLVKSHPELLEPELTVCT